MADKSVSELIAATQVTPSDLFVLEQSGVAKKLTGQILENWLLSFADGHGGIQSIAKKSTSGLVDTYRITLADTTTFDFLVTNGKSITKIAKTKTSGLVDTYTITYNDSKTSTFTVTNGAKGDPGTNQYVWIKYASKQPTSTSHSFGDVPDNWIGIYSGAATTAPTDWTQYKWFEMKGKQGEPGEPASLVQSKVEYQVSTSGSIIPSNQWLTNVPVVGQGKYLWTKLSLLFNSGDPVVSYSVARFGVDGAGSVSSINDVGPDENGNVQLDATSIRALSLDGGDMEGSINMNGQPIDGLNAPTSSNQAANKEYVDVQNWTKTGTSIPSTADLNDYRTPGKYYHGSSKTSGSIGNCPVPEDNFVLFVMVRTSGSSLQQIIITMHGVVYVRGCPSSGAWWEWERLANTDYVDTAIANGGTAPVRGVDYWTVEDQAYIVRQVIDSLGTPVFGSVDASNNIVLSGNLAKGTYTVKYEDATGKVTNIGTLVESSGSVSYTNRLPLATGSDSSVYNGTGYKSGVRWSNSSNAESSYTGCYLSGYIHVEKGDIIRLKNVGMKNGSDGNLCAIYHFTSKGTSLEDYYVNNTQNMDKVSPVWSGDTLVQFTALNSGYIRVTATYMGSDSIITVNEAIV